MTTSGSTLFRAVFSDARPLIGVVHLPPLPGYPASPGIEALIAHALADLRVLERLGYDGVLLENENDRPHRVLAGPETTAALTRIAAAAVSEARRIAVGVEILLNDPRASLAVALASGARFIRTDYFVDRMARDEHGGEMAIDPVGLLSYRERIGAGAVAVLADVQVKYARMLEARSIAESTRLAFERRADAVIVTGSATGLAPDVDPIDEAASAGWPILVGSGLTAENAPTILAAADGALVGTGILVAGKVDPARAGRLLDVARTLPLRRR